MNSQKVTFNTTEAVSHTEVTQNPGFRYRLQTETPELISVDVANHEQTSVACNSKKSNKKRKHEVTEAENNEVFDSLANMVDKGISFPKNKDKHNNDVTNFEILAELRLNRKKINMIYNIVKEQNKEENDVIESFPIDLPISSVAQLKEIEDMMDDSDLKDKLKIHLTEKLKLQKQHSSEDRTKLVMEELFDDGVFNDISFGAKREGEKPGILHVSSFKFFTNFMKGKYFFNSVKF